jgi:hypothetical protein
MAMLTIGNAIQSMGTRKKGTLRRIELTKRSRYILPMSQSEKHE